MVFNNLLLKTVRKPYVLVCKFSLFMLDRRGRRICLRILRILRLRSEGQIDCEIHVVIAIRFFGMRMMPPLPILT